MTTTTIGCGVLFNFNRVMRLDPVILTQEDLPTMRLRENERLDRFPEESSILVGCEQRWNVNQLIVRYYLFPSEYTAQKVWKNAWGYRVSGPAIFRSRAKSREHHWRCHMELYPQDTHGKDKRY